MPQQIITFVNQETGQPIGRLEMEPGQDISWEAAEALAEVIEKDLGVKIVLDINPA